MKLVAWAMLICTSFVMTQDPATSTDAMDVDSSGRNFSSDYYPAYPNMTTEPSNTTTMIITTTTTITSTTTPNGTTTTTTTATSTTTTSSTTSSSENTAETGRVYTLGNTGLTFEIIVVTMEGIAIFFILTTCMVVCSHKSSYKRLEARVSGLVSDQRHNRVAPISKSPRSPGSPRNDYQFAGTGSRRSPRAKADIDEVVRLGFNTWRGKQSTSRKEEDERGNALPAKSPEQRSPGKDKKSPRRVPAARRATDGLF